MRIKWSDYVSNVEVFRRAGMSSAESVLVTTQPRWAGHVARMGEDRIPKILLYGELANRNRKAGRGTKTSIQGCNKENGY